MSTTQAILQNQVTNMLALEKHIFQALERQIDSDEVNQNRAASTLINRMHRTVNEHVSHLDALASEYGGNATVQEAAASFAGSIAGIFDTMRGYTASKALRDDYTAFSLAAISYTMLHTTAVALNDARVANIALAHLKQITPIITEISETMPHVIAAGLAESNPGIALNVNAATVSEEQTQEAWSSEFLYAERA